MSDPFQSPGVEDGADTGRSLALVGAGCLYAVSAVSGLLLVLGLLVDVVSLFVVLAEGQAIAPYLIGAVCREGFLLVLAAGAFQGAQALRRPDLHGTVPVALRELESIYDSERLATRQDLPTSPRYADTSAHGLVEVWHGIDREAAGERFAELLAEVKERVERARQPAVDGVDEPRGPVA